MVKKNRSSLSEATNNTNTTISTTVSRSHLLATSFENIDGSIVTVVMNQSDLKINYKLFVGDYLVEETLLPHSIQTFIY